MVWMEIFKATSVALSAVQNLQSYCNKIIIAGSIRREKTEVKEIDVVLVPKRLKSVSGRCNDLVLTPDYVRAVLDLGKGIKGVPSSTYMQIGLPEGIELNLHRAEDRDWGRQVALRTGSSEYAYKVLSPIWVSQGWVGTDQGLFRKEECVKAGPGAWKLNTDEPTMPPVWQEEEEFFEWLKLTWKEPKDRFFPFMEN